MCRSTIELAKLKNMRKKISLGTQSFLYTLAGIIHFIHPAPYQRIMPRWLPGPDLLIAISGAAEIAFGLMLLVPATRRLAAWGIILLLIAVLPANVQMMLDYLRENNPYAWLTVLRIPLQGVLIWWIWPFTQKP